MAIAAAFFRKGRAINDPDSSQKKMWVTPISKYHRLAEMLAKMKTQIRDMSVCFTLKTSCSSVDFSFVHFSAILSVLQRLSPATYHIEKLSQIKLNGELEQIIVMRAMDFRGHAMCPTSHLLKHLLLQPLLQQSDLSKSMIIVPLSLVNHMSLAFRSRASLMLQCVITIWCLTIRTCSGQRSSKY